MQTIIWEVECLSCANMRRHCKKCGGKTEFISSGLFRVNANKKKLDIWLVYRCGACGSSWNLPIYERTNPNRLPKALLEKFLRNDDGLARQYAMDTALQEAHGCEVPPPVFTISGENVPKGQAVQVVIKSARPLGIRVDKLLRQKLGLSAKGLDTLLQNGCIRLPGGEDPRRQKIATEARLTIHLAAVGDSDEDEPPAA